MLPTSPYIFAQSTPLLHYGKLPVTPLPAAFGARFFHAARKLRLTVEEGMVQYDFESEECEW
jgi:hypothetical protein